MANSSYKSGLQWLIIIATLLRCIIAASVGLGNDEVYYYTYALQPEWNYFDHPPAVGFLIRLFTIDLHWLNAFSMRLGAIVCAALATWLIAAIGTLMKNERTGLLAALIYNASIYTSIISGLFILPDSPAVVFWLAAIYSMMKVIKTDKPGVKNLYLLLFGWWVGLAMMSKVHGAFLWLGFAGYICLYQQELLKKWQLYLAMIITAFIVLPVLLWNLQYDFITWRFHGDRVAIKDSGINLKSFATALIGQILYNNPLLIVLYSCAATAYLKRKQPGDNNNWRLLLWIGLPIILATIFTSLFRNVLPHWSGPGFIPFMLLTAVWLDEKQTQADTRYNKLLKAAVIFPVALLVLAVLAVRYYPGTLGRKEGLETGRGDITLDMYGWQQLASEFDGIRKKDSLEKTMSVNAALLTNKWFPGGHCCFYVIQPLQMRIVGAGTLKDLHKFVWLNKSQGYIAEGEDAYFIAPSNYFNDPAEIYKTQFREISLAATLPQERAGKIARYWYIYRLKGATQQVGNRIN